LKKFIIGCIVCFVLYFVFDYVYYQTGFHIDLHPDAPIETFVKTEGKEILLNQGEGYEEFEIRGVDMGVGIPGKFATDYAIDTETYLRWFSYIQEMGANTIRVYTLLQPDFYEAVYEYNKDREEPLYIIHGLWVNDHVLYSHVDAYDDSFLGTMLEDSKTLVNIIHGRQKLQLGEGLGTGSYTKDISPWVLGYILGVEWEDVTVAYTDEMREDKNNYQGKYMKTTWNATPFEAMLAQVGDKLIQYETNRYKSQRLVAFSNWPTTDPLDYPDNVTRVFKKIAKVDVEHIEMTEEFLSGTFASYHIYPYYPDFLRYMSDEYEKTYVDKTGKVNTYYSYLKMINEHHTVPVIISEFGIPTSRGMAQTDLYTGRNQGRMSEQDQGKAIQECYEDIMDAGCSGSIIFTWQDEWFKRTWNTMHYIDLTKTPYWSDYQTNEQYFGLLSFDPGEEQSICYVDGDLSEWTDEDIVISDGEASVSMKYDEKFVYFLVYKKGFTGEETLYLPIDITQKTGSNYCRNPNLKFERDADFLIVIDGEEESRVLVQERYNPMRPMFYESTHGRDPYYNIPDKNSPKFERINLILRHQGSEETEDEISKEQSQRRFSEVYETGLLTYGNASPNAEDFNSLADFCFSGEYVEIKLPWQLLNFSNPSEMMVHDDYYEHYGIENLKIDNLYIGIGSENTSNERIMMNSFSLKGWGKKVTYHERLKESYYDIQEMWTKE